MREGTEGFLYPTINKHTCTDCGMCVVLYDQMKDDFIIRKISQLAFAVKNRD